MITILRVLLALGVVSGCCISYGRVAAAAEEAACVRAGGGTADEPGTLLQQRVFPAAANERQLLGVRNSGGQVGSTKAAARERQRGPRLISSRRAGWYPARLAQQRIPPLLPTVRPRPIASRPGAQRARSGDHARVPGTSADPTHGKSLAAAGISAGKYPGLFQSATAKGVTGTNRRAGLQVAGDGTLTAFDAPSGRKAFFCNPEKVGSTRWKALLYKSKGDPWHAPHTVFPRWAVLPAPEKRRKAEDPARARFMFVRNPYSRLLSGFLDKAVHPVGILNPANPKNRRSDTILGHGGPYTDSPAEFLRFVETMNQMMARQPGLPGMNGHFAPLTFRCGLNAGITYDFFLKVEETDTWYPDLVTLLGLADATAAGWERKNSTGAGDGCFHKIPGMSCAQTTAALKRHADNARHPALLPQGGGDAPLEWMTRQTTTHARGADSLWRRYYNSDAVIEAATKFLAGDLELFGYETMSRLSDMDVE
eukprot:jgi/Tetstr1/449951/TSEL_037005.t1